MDMYNEHDELEEELEEYLEIPPVPKDCIEKDRTRAIRRKNNVKKSVRKKKLDKDIRGTYANWTPRPLHQYSKNKIHCSCPLCRAKTNKRANGLYGTYSRKGKNWKHSDLKKIESIENKKEPE